MSHQKVSCCLCGRTFVAPGNLVWLKDGPAHSTCWVEEVKRIPVRKVPLKYDPKLIYADYYDAMTMQKLHPKQVVNRFNKRQYFTFFTQSGYRGPDLS